MFRGWVLIFVWKKIQTIGGESMMSVGSSPLHVGEWRSLFGVKILAKFFNLIFFISADIVSWQANGILDPLVEHWPLLHKCHAKSSFCCLLSQWEKTNSNMGLLNCSTLLHNVKKSFQIAPARFYMYDNIPISSRSIEYCIKSKWPF